MAHRSYHAFEELNNHLHLVVDHAARVYVERGQTPDALYTCENCYAVNRVFVVLAAAPGSAVLDRDSGRSTPLLADSVVYMPAQVAYAFRFAAGLELVAFHFRLELVGGLDLFAGRRGVETRMGGWRDTGERLAGLLEQADSVAALTALRGAVWSLAATFLDLDLATLRDRLRRQAAYAPLFTLLERDCHAGLRVTDLARAMGMTADTLSRQFRRDTGVNLKVYLARQVYQRAAPLLLYSPRSVKQIAADLGFRSEFYFSRFFKRHAGVSPRDYRRQQPHYAPA